MTDDERREQERRFREELHDAKEDLAHLRAKARSAGAVLKKVGELLESDPEQLHVLGQSQQIDLREGAVRYLDISALNDYVDVGVVLKLVDEIRRVNSRIRELSATIASFHAL